MKELTLKRASTDICPGIKDGIALLNLARGWLKQGNAVVAIELLKSARNSVEAGRNQQLRAQILKETGRALMMQSDWESSEAHYLEAQQVFLDIEDHKGASECVRNRANMYFQKGRFADSEELCRQALEWASVVGDYELRATILNTLGAIKSATGELKEAVRVFKLCLADFESSGNRLRQGYVLLNIGLAQIELSESDEAIVSLNQALAMALDEKDLSLVEICYQNISKCYLAQKETNLAKSVIDTARKILPGLNSKALETELNLIDCQIMRTMGNLHGAHQLLEKTYDMAIDHKLHALQADVLFEQGLLEKQRGRPELAVTKLDAAANQYKLIGVDKGFRQTVQALENLKRSNNG